MERDHTTDTQRQRLPSGEDDKRTPKGRTEQMIHRGSRPFLPTNCFTKKLMIMDKNANCCVVKFHDGEKYAVSVVSGKKDECLRKAAYFRGIFQEDRFVNFGVYPAWYIDYLVKMERQGGSSLYELLTTTSIH